jgi:hypothetical protein
MTNPSLYQSPLQLIWHLSKSWIPGINNVTLSAYLHRSSETFHHYIVFLFSVFLLLLVKFQVCSERINDQIKIRQWNTCYVLSL